MIVGVREDLGLQFQVPAPNDKRKTGEKLWQIFPTGQLTRRS